MLCNAELAAALCGLAVFLAGSLASLVLDVDGLAVAVGSSVHCQESLDIICSTRAGSLNRTVAWICAC